MTAGEDLGEAAPGTDPAGETSETAAESDGEGAPLGPVRKPHGRIRLKWGGQVVLGALLVGLVGSLATVRLAWLPDWLGLAVAGALAVLGLGWVLLRYRLWAFQLRTDALYLERGVVTHVETVVPHVRIQHVDTSRGPVDRVLGLSTLVVYTAGSRGADVAIPGLPTDAAADLQRRVKELAIEAEGGDAL
jgi:hypothetical protein